MSFTDSSHSDAKSIQKNREKPILDKQFDHVMCFGTFDIFHPGHEFYLRESQKFAQKMTIVIARDHRVFSGKGKNPIHNESSRLEIVQKSFPDTHVILGDEVDIFSPIRTLAPDLLAFGYDQRVPEDRIRELFPHIEIVRIGGYETEKWKSSIIRKTREQDTGKILLIPGTGQSVKNYGNYAGLDIWTEPELREYAESIDCIIGHSLGATYALTHSTNPDTKFVLINPLLQKKNFPSLLLSWMRFMFSEGFDMKKAIPSKYWFHMFRYAIKLSQIDIIPLLVKIPKENLYIIRGKQDTFFCDNNAVSTVREYGFHIIEVDAGHDWNRHIAEAVEQLVS